MTRWPARAVMEQRILETADRLFYSQGIRAVGVDTIAAETGISKRTLYNYFRSKDGLIAAYLARRAAAQTTSDRPPLEQILRTFDWLQRWFASKDYRGCPFVNAVAELGEPAHPAARISLAFKEKRRLWFRDMLVQVGAVDPDGLASQLAILVEGAIAAALVRRDPSVAEAAKAAARVLLANAGVIAAPDAPAHVSQKVVQPHGRRTSKRKLPRGA
jgi:AcrR family transcriptional regulator